ncbi:hypothetical protein KIN20_025237 [Parelaphostrongylus tenuis]|uniref:Uncharacterized protein n=1 Tax=Parelaphostrongylus tenuis TaxID=148309 RepID=A0AAD5MZ92_PARTN|nr:hypothetical protein KIN20_025237 [Parelaphostrongylus tenuis]
MPLICLPKNGVILTASAPGRMDYHCVLTGTDPRNVTIADLAIPDTMCSQKGEGGYECPDNMVCMKLDMSAHVEGFYGMFNDFGGCSVLMMKT